METSIKGDNQEEFKKAMRNYIEDTNNADGCLR
jgi:quinol monooxygenase YgiN